MMIATSAFSTTLENRNNLDLTPEGSSLEEYLVIRLSNVKFPSQIHNGKNYWGTNKCVHSFQSME